MELLYSITCGGLKRLRSENVTCRRSLQNKPLSIPEGNPKERNNLIKFKQYEN